jgi:hypothetical protein
MFALKKQKIPYISKNMQFFCVSGLFHLALTPFDPSMLKEMAGSPL